jgi:hypothetical protein
VYSDADRRRVLEQMKKDEGEFGQIKSITKQEPQFDSMYALENDEATVLYVVGMCVATIFRGNFILWIVFTIIWFRYIHRHDKGGK